MAGVVKPITNNEAFALETEIKVSVIVVTYNHAAFIAKSLDSILSQVTDFPFEVIVTDDASTDETAAIVRRYAVEFPDRIKPILAQTNVGPSANFEKALKLASGKYLAYCDGDDYWNDNAKLQQAVDVLDANPDYSIFVHDTMIHDTHTGANTNVVGDYWKKSLTNNTFTLENSQYTHISGRVFRNIPFPDLRDTFMYHYLLAQGSGYYCDRVMSVYNYNGEGVWSSLPKRTQDILNYQMMYDLNHFFDYKYDVYYTQLMPEKLRKYKRWLGKKLGWKIFLISQKI